MAREDIPAARFGHIPGISIGKWWPKRKEICADNVHPLPIHGIYGRKEDGARSVVLSGKSEFQDEDQGETFTYIGSGGRAPGVRFGPQTENQGWHNSSNEALRISALLRRPVRVNRGRGGSRFAPYDGYRYDGLYLVSNPRIELGPEGYEICKFDFTRIANQDPLPLDRGPRDKIGQAERRQLYWQVKRAESAPTDIEAESVASSPIRELESADIAEEVISIADDSDDYDEDADVLEALFSTTSEVEEALLPVHPHLARFARTGETIAEKLKRRVLIKAIGRHIKSSVREKADAREDAALWNYELWTFVLKSVPRESKTLTAEKLERYYERLERREQERRREPPAGLGTALNPINIL